MVEEHKLHGDNRRNDSALIALLENMSDTIKESRTETREGSGNLHRRMDDMVNDQTERLDQHDLRQEARTLRLEEKMDGALMEHVKEDKAAFEDHGNRLRRIERFGVSAAAVGGAVGFGLTFKDQIAKVGKFLGLW